MKNTANARTKIASIILMTLVLASILVLPAEARRSRYRYAPPTPTISATLDVKRRGPMVYVTVKGDVRNARASTYVSIYQNGRRIFRARTAPHFRITRRFYCRGTANIRVVISSRYARTQVLSDRVSAYRR